MKELRRVRRTGVSQTYELICTPSVQIYIYIPSPFTIGSDQVKSAKKTTLPFLSFESLPSSIALRLRSSTSTPAAAPPPAPATSPSHAPPAHVDPRPGAPGKGSPHQAPRHTGASRTESSSSSRHQFQLHQVISSYHWEEMKKPITAELENPCKSTLKILNGVQQQITAVQVLHFIYSTSIK
jgi:hypothetical protein